jgi:hydroxypyruvate isomerase
MIKFAANLSMLFPEVPLLERFQKAADAGFRVVEIWSPLDEGLAEAKKNAGVELLQFNLDEGDESAGERGFLSIPDQQQRFRSGFKNAIRYADKLNVQQFNCLTGNREPAYSWEAQMACMRENLEWLYPQLEANDLRLNIEPLNLFSSPYYLLPWPKELFSILKALELPRIGVQYDLFHAQLMEGNLIATMRENLSLIGHIQIADAPGRHQPGTGAIDYRFVLAEIDAMGYEGFIGIEYVPLGLTVESLSWLPVGSRVQTRARDLKF